MTLPGFPRTSRSAVAGDRLFPQQIPCEDEFRPPCESGCEHSWNPDCVDECIEEMCSTPWPPK